MLGGVPTRLTFFLPEGYEFTGADADEAEIVDVKKDNNGIVIVTLRREETVLADWRISVERE